MGRALILVESLAAALLLVALAAAWAARRRAASAAGGCPRRSWPPWPSPPRSLAYGLGFLHQMGTVSLTSFVAATAWTLALPRRVARRHPARRCGRDATRRRGRGRSGRWPWRSPPPRS